MKVEDLNGALTQYLMILERRYGTTIENLILEHLYTHPKFLEFYEEHTHLFYPGVHKVSGDFCVELNTVIKIRFPIILRQAVELVYKCEVNTQEIRDLSRAITKFYKTRGDKRPLTGNVHHYRLEDLGIVGLALWHEGLLTFSEVLERLNKFIKETGLEKCQSLPK